MRGEKLRLCDVKLQRTRDGGVTVGSFRIVVAVVVAESLRA